MKTLKEVACGSTVKVKKLTGEGPVKRRIMDMGITKGVDIYVRKVAPLGDPIEVTVRGYVDTIIEPADTRKYVIGAFEMLFTKREERPSKKHGTI